MYINTFKYTPKDVSCQLCTEYVKKLGCTALRCPWLAERIEAGVVGYREAVLETFPHERRLFQRLNLLIKHYPGSLWSNEQHERRMQYQCAVQGYRRRRDTNAYYAAMYLLTSNDDIYRRTANCFCKDGIEFGYAVLKNTSPHNYALFMAARDLCDKTEAVTMADLAEPEVIDPEALCLIVNATLIARYLEQYPEISVYDTYIDNGATGTNFHRPGFQQMLSDIEAGHVNCVIVKDLSRLGRNTIDTGYYIEQYFRIRNIRFIAVNENFDTAAPEDAHSGIIIPLRNMINEAYALDIGRKIRAQQRQAMKDGKFIGARTPYGYLKAEDDCHQLIIDPVAAIVVQRMFRWASEGAGLNTIAVRLNEAGILTPSHYKKMQGKITHENLLGSGKWQTRTVGVILRSEVYTGDLVQGQTKTVDHRQVKADAEEWTGVRDTHEAIISREQFAAVQEILNQTASRAKAREVKAFTPNLLKGKVFCAHCGGSLHRQRNIRKKSDDVYFYHCLSQSRISKDACPGVTIREDALLDMLADMLQDALDTALGQYTLSLAELPRQAADRAELREKITSRKQEIQRLRGIVRSLYENLVQGVLTKDEYFDYKEKYESRIADLAVEMEQLEDGLRTMDAQTEQHRALEQDAAQIKTDRALTGALIERLIDRIEVSHDKQITVRYRFQSEFETYAEVLEQCRNM